jgi:hypothetical protein
MCSVAFAMAAAQTATTYMAQKQAAEAQEAVQQRATINENKRHLLEMGTVRLRQAQEDVASAQKISENQRAANIAFATATTAAAPGAGGVSGLSVSALLGGIMQGQARRDVSILQQQRAADLGRFVAMRDAGNRTTQNYLRINKPVKQESILEAAMAGAQTGLSTQQAISSFA